MTDKIRYTLPRGASVNRNNGYSSGTYAVILNRKEPFRIFFLLKGYAKEVYRNQNTRREGECRTKTRFPNIC
ncbi:MAG: hypothetical protein K2M07_07375 [Muribaculaceae bacterium]|nr:hypothetical protein [Muribaculaceae bacterium]